MFHPREALTLKAVVDCWGEVWAAEGKHMPSATGLNATQFVRSRQVADFDNFRTDGHEDNVELLNEIYCLKAETSHPLSIEVCSPLVWGDGPRTNPQKAILRMTTWLEPASVGGFCQFDARMFASYGIAHALNTTGEFTPYVEWLTYRHPAWAGASFVSSIEPEQFARLVASILDPRWYVDPDHPEKISRLAMKMGINNRIYRDVEVDRISTKRHESLRQLNRCWNVGSPPISESPRDFLWRHKKDNPGEFSELKVSKKFLNFLRWVWLDSLASPNFVGKLFDPMLFFDRPSDALAYEEHLRLHKVSSGA